MLLEVAQLGQPILRQVASEVPREQIDTVDFRQFIDAMTATLREQKGVGLAAPQVFASVRVFLAAILPPDEPEGPPNIETFINPTLTFLTTETDDAWEGCLSFAELLVLVPRYRAVRIDYLNGQGVPSTRELTDFEARVVQHEYDHLDGILTIDRAATTRDIVKASEIEAVLEDRSEEEDEEPAD